MKLTFGSVFKTLISNQLVHFIPILMVTGLTGAYNNKTLVAGFTTGNS